MSFQAAVAKANAAKSSSKRLSNDQLLQLYAHYKSATVGPNRSARPGAFDMKGLAKWNAWSALGGLSQAQAQAKYVQLVNQWC